MTEKPEQFRRFIDRKITIFTLGLQNADIDSPQLISKENLPPFEMVVPPRFLFSKMAFLYHLTDQLSRVYFSD